MPPAEPIADFLGELLVNRKASSPQLQSASAAVHTAATAYCRRDVASSFRASGSGSADYEDSGEETDSDQDTASLRSSAARVSQAEAKALESTAKLQSLLAQRDGVVNGEAAGTVRSAQGRAGVEREQAGTGTAKGMDVATEYWQEGSAPSKRSQHQTRAAPSPPMQEPMAAPEPAAPEAGAATAAAVPLPPSAGAEAAGSLAVAPPLPTPDSSQLLGVPTPSSSQAPLPPMATANLVAEPFSPAAEGWSLQSAGTQPPLPASTLSRPPPPLPLSLLPRPPPPPLPSPGLPRSAGPTGRMSGASDAEIEFIPLGRSSSAGGAKVSPGARRAGGAAVKVAGTGKKSFLFSDEEQKALGNASGKGKGKPGKVSAVKTKIKVKKPGAAAKPKVADVFTDEHRASATKVSRLRQERSCS